MAKRSKGFGEPLHQHLNKQQQRSMDKLARRVKSNLKDQVAGVVVNPKGQAKMSDILEAFIEPYLDSACDLEQRRKLFAMAAFAWNLALFPEDEQQQELEQIVEQLSAGDQRLRQNTKEILEELIERKQQYFRKHQRYILDFELTETRSDFHLSVVSSMSPDTKNS